MVELITAVMTIISAVIAYLRGGGAEARKQLSRANDQLALWKHRALTSAERNRELEKIITILRRKHREDLSDDALLELASKLRVGSNGNGVH